MRNWIFFIFLLQSCLWSKVSLEGRYGIQDVKKAYIPARTAVAPCQKWPSFASFEELHLTNFSPEEQASLCNAFDEFVLNGFDSQPYMQGISPRLVTKLLAEASPPFSIESGFEHWKRQETDCVSCRDPLKYYQTSIEPR